MADTLCGLDLDLLTKRPKPEELASIVAHMSSEDQAEFFCHLGEKLRNHCGRRIPARWTNIAEDIKAIEERCLDSSGSELIAELHFRLMAEVA